MKHFLSEIKKHIGYSDKGSKKYLSDFKNSIVSQYGSSASYYKLIEHYGDPKDIARTYLETAGIGKLVSKRKQMNYLITAVVVCIGIFVVFVIKAYVESRDTYINREQTVIEEDN